MFNNLNTFQNNRLKIKKKNMRGAVLLQQLLLKGEKVVTIRLRKTGGKSLQATGQMQCSISKLLLLYITTKRLNCLSPQRNVWTFNFKSWNFLEVAELNPTTSDENFQLVTKLSNLEVQYTSV